MSSAGTQREPMFSGHSGTRSNSIQIDPLPEHCRTRAHTSGSLSSDHAQENAGEPQGSADPKPFPEQGRMLAQRPQLTRSGSEPATTSTSTTALTGNLRASFPIPQRPHDHVAPVATSGLTNISLLLVDDNAINLRILEAFAKKGGHAYRKACNGQEAVDLYRNAAIGGPGESRKGTSTSASDPHVDMTTMRKPEIILMDINMPIMDGFEATRAIRNFEQFAKVPRATIIAVTGLGDTNAQDEAFACGMDLFLTKPLRMKDLLEVFASLDL